MINHKELEKLLRTKPLYPTISLYLNTDPTTNRKKDWLKFFKNQGKILKNLEPKIYQKIENLLSRLAPQTKGIVLFANKNLWQVFSLAIPIENHIVISDHPVIDILTKILDEFERYLVVLFDQQKSRLIIITQGEIEKEKTITSDILGRHRSGGWSQKRFDLRRKKGIERHFLKTIQEIEDLIKRFKIRRILLATQEEAAAEFMKKLKKEIKNKIIGQIHLDMDESYPEIIQKTMTKITKIENKEEKETVNKLMDNLKTKGIVGLEEVIKAAQEEKILKLIILDGLKVKGWSCPKCKVFGAGSLTQKCPYCNTTIQKEKNIIEKIVEKVAPTQNATIEIIKENEEFNRLGGIGAVLRY